MNRPQKLDEKLDETLDVRYELRTTRREFLIGISACAGSLLVAKYAHSAERATFQPHAFLRITADDVFTLFVGKSEMGQGIHTGLAMILAEELDIDPQKLVIEVAGVAAAFQHPFLPAQFTGGSNSTQTLFEPLRKVGATARRMLLTACSQAWNVDIQNLHTDNGFIVDGQRRVSYGSMAAAASRLAVPKDVTLKSPQSYKYLGKSQSRLDSADKVTGSARFGIDVRLPNMLVAMVARAPTFGASLRNFDASPAMAIVGVVKVKKIPSGVAVLATNTWAAQRGRNALITNWDLGDAVQLSTRSQRESYRRLAATPGTRARDVGNVEEALAAAARRIDVFYEFPYLAHACMEPLNATVHVTADRCDVWSGTQAPSFDAANVAKILGRTPDAITVHTLFLGGGFGRRGTGDSDFIVEAAHVANGEDVPVQTLWTRDDDMRGGYYRPSNVSRVRAGIDTAGRPVAFHHVIVGQNVHAKSPFQKFVVKNGVDRTSVEGSADMPYPIEHLRVEVHNTEQSVPILWWRSVGHSINGFVTNTTLDELAVLGHRDPLELRRSLLVGKTRHLAVLDKLAAAANYGKTLRAGHFHGLALHESFGTIVGQIAEVSVRSGNLRVHRVTCVVDCGIAINPNQVVAQMEGSIIFALSAALHGEIAIEDGQVLQRNFDSYRVLRLNEAPKIDVHIVGSDAPLGGVGEPGVPPLAPAVCNAVFRATGIRVRRLPIANQLHV